MKCCNSQSDTQLQWFPHYSGKGWRESAELVPLIGRKGWYLRFAGYSLYVVLHIQLNIWHHVSGFKVTIYKTWEKPLTICKHPFVLIAN